MSEHASGPEALGTTQPDPRPRPQYGEYATPEEQQARIRQPDATDALTSGHAPEQGEGPAPAKPVTPAGPAAAAADSAVGAPPRRGPVIDRMVTVALLVYGLLSMTTTAPALFEFEQLASTSMDAFGIEGGFTNFSAGRLWGGIAAIILIVGWIATALLSWRRLRRGKLAFWIPLVGLVVVGVLVTICLTVPIAGDPAFIDYVNRTTGQG